MVGEWSRHVFPQIFVRNLKPRSGMRSDVGWRNRCVVILITASIVILAISLHDRERWEVKAMMGDGRALV